MTERQFLRPRTQLEVDAEKSATRKTVASTGLALVLSGIIIWQSIDVFITMLGGVGVAITVDPNLPYDTSMVGPRGENWTLLYPGTGTPLLIGAIAAVGLILASIFGAYRIAFHKIVDTVMLGSLVVLTAVAFASGIIPKYDYSATFSTWAEQRYGVEVPDDVDPESTDAIVLDGGREVLVNNGVSHGERGYILIDGLTGEELPVDAGEKEPS